MKVAIPKFEVFTALLFRWLAGYIPEDRYTANRH